MNETSKVSVKRFNGRRILSSVLALIMILYMIPLSSLQVWAGDTVKIKLHFINSSNWSEVCVYAGEGNDSDWSLFTASWPGDKLSKDSNGYYTYEITKNTSTRFNYIFNNGSNAAQTEDLFVNTSDMKNDADGVIELWVDATGNVSQSAGAGMPVVDGNKVTFTYKNDSASSVYLAGTMNGWSTTKNKMTKNAAGVFTYTVELAPGQYEYKYVVDGNWVSDPSNPITIGNDNNSVAIVPGMTTAIDCIKDGSSIVLPSQLTYYTTGSSTKKDVTYTSATSGVTISGYKVTLGNSFSGNQFTVNAKAKDGATSAVTVTLYDATSSTIKELYDTEEFESLFTYTGNDLGATWTKSKTTFKVWAPTATAVKVQLYATGSDKETASKKLETYTMKKGSNGVWSVDVTGDLNGVYYTYLTTVNGTTEESCDPYARTTGVNGNRAMVLDMDSTDPAGWDNDNSPNEGMSYTDAIIYELHIRDLSIDDESGVKEEWRGKFLGLTQSGTTNSSGISTGLDHIKDLGVTHIHLLPSYDYASIDETLTEAEKAADTSKQFNWGYDPQNYNVPEGSYSTDPYNGAVRVNEMKQMVQTLHANGINVIMDVVYNHVYDAGNFCVNEIVPDYFSRTNADGTYSNGSGCGNDTASERAMVRKYIVDSVKYWADEYHIDGFRFDLVGLLDAETINLVVEEVHKTHPDVIFYGEGWTMGTAVNPSDTLMSTHANAYATPNFAYFSDTIRDFIKGKNDESTWGFIQGTDDGDPEGTLNECFTASTWWIRNPIQVINYASCHDNYTLMDKINATMGSSSLADRIKMNNLAAAVYITAEGIPLIHAGEEMLRTKVDKNGNIVHNSYNSPDYINSLKWGNLSSKDYQNVRDYYAGLIEFRKNHQALRLTTKDDVNKYVKFTWIENNVVMFNIAGDKVQGEVSDGIIVIFNSNSTAKTFSIYSDTTVAKGDWKVCVNDKSAGTTVLSTIKDGKVTVAGSSALILVKGETVDKNSVYVTNAAIAKENAANMSAANGSGTGNNGNQAGSQGDNQGGNDGENQTSDTTADQNGNQDGTQNDATVDNETTTNGNGDMTDDETDNKDTQSGQNNTTKPDNGGNGIFVWIIVIVVVVAVGVGAGFGIKMYLTKKKNAETSDMDDK